MDKNGTVEKMAASLEEKGDIRFYSADMDIYIQSIDSKEGYSYINLDGKEFNSSYEAVEWAIAKFMGIENIGRWE